MLGDGRTEVRLALGWGILTGVATLLTMPPMQPEQVALASDAYYHATAAFLEGANPYLASATPDGVSAFLYPPGVLLAFLPHVLTGSATGAYVLQTLLNLATVAALAWLVLRILDRRDVALARVDRALLAGFVALSPHATTVLIMGQVNLQLALAVAVGAVLVERDRDRLAGVAFALAAAVKLFPAVAGAWLLRLRRWRAVAMAILTGLATLLVGVLVVDRETLVTYFTETLPSEGKTAEFAGGLPPDAMYVTVRRPIAALVPDLDPALYAPLALLVLVPVVLACYRSVDTLTGRWTALLATVLAGIVALPLEAFYFSLLYVPLLPLLYTLEPGWPRHLLAAGTVLLSTVVTYRTVTRLLDVAGLPAGLEEVIRSLAGVLTVVQPPLVGAVLVLAGCVLWQHRAVADGAAADEA